MITKSRDWETSPGLQSLVCSIRQHLAVAAMRPIAFEIEKDTET